MATMLYQIPIIRGGRKGLGIQSAICTCRTQTMSRKGALALPVQPAGLEQTRAAINGRRRGTESSDDDAISEELQDREPQIQGVPR